jgi:hypothetical protein
LYAVFSIEFDEKVIVGKIRVLVEMLSEGKTRERV